MNISIHSVETSHWLKKTGTRPWNQPGTVPNEVLISYLCIKKQKMKQLLMGLILVPVLPHWAKHNLMTCKHQVGSVDDGPNHRTNAKNICLLCDGLRRGHNGLAGSTSVQRNTSLRAWKAMFTQVSPEPPMPMQNTLYPYDTLLYTASDAATIWLYSRRTIYRWDAALLKNCQLCLLRTQTNLWSLLGDHPLWP